MDAKWQKLAACKEQVAGQLELARQAKQIGHSLDARVTIKAAGEQLALLQEMAAELPHLFIVSQCVLEAKADGELEISVEPAHGHKCARCWIYSEDIEAEGSVCPRCAAVLEKLPEEVLTDAE